MTKERRAKGVLGEAKVLAHMVAEGFSVFLPFAECGPFDLVASMEGNLLRVSIKSSGQLGRYGGWKVTLKNVSRRANNETHTKLFDPDSCDILAIYLISTENIVLLDAKKINAKHAIIVHEDDFRRYKY